MDVAERKVPTLIDRTTEGSKHKLTLDMTGCEDAAKQYLEDIGVQYSSDGSRHTAYFTLDSDNATDQSLLDRIINDSGVGKKIAGYGIVRALAFPLEFHEEVDEAEYGKVAAATTVQIGGKKKKEMGLWVWEYAIPVMIAIMIGVGYAGLATHQRNMDLYTPVTLDQLRGGWYDHYHSSAGLDAYLNPATNNFTLSFPVDSIISEAKKLTLVKAETDTILIVGDPQYSDGTWYPDEKQFVNMGENQVEYTDPDSVGIEKYAGNIVDPLIIEYNLVDKVRDRFEIGRDKIDVMLTGTILVEEGEYFMPAKKGKIKLLPGKELQKLYLNIAAEVTILGNMRFYQWINENDPKRSRKTTEIVGEFDLAFIRVGGKYM